MCDCRKRNQLRELKQIFGITRTIIINIETIYVNEKHQIALLTIWKIQSLIDVFLSKKRNNILSSLIVRINQTQTRDICAPILVRLQIERVKV